MITAATIKNIKDHFKDYPYVSFITETDGSMKLIFRKVSLIHEHVKYMILLSLIQGLTYTIQAVEKNVIYFHIESEK